MGKAKNMHEYKHIRAWGRMLSSYEHYVQDEQRKAFKDDAPLDVVYYNTDRQHWVRFSEVTNEDTKATIERLLKGM